MLQQAQQMEVARSKSQRLADMYKVEREDVGVARKVIAEDTAGRGSRLVLDEIAQVET